MTPRDRVVPLILANVDAAERGAWLARCPRRDVPDVVQGAVLVALERAERGGFGLPDDPVHADRIVAAFLYVTARNLTIMRGRADARTTLPGDYFPEQRYDPLPALEARSELRRLAHASEMSSLLKSDVTIEDFLYGPDVNPSTRWTRLARLRNGGWRRE